MFAVLIESILKQHDVFTSDRSLLVHIFRRYQAAMSKGHSMKDTLQNLAIAAYDT